MQTYPTPLEAVGAGQECYGYITAGTISANSQRFFLCLWNVQGGLQGLLVGAPVFGDGAQGDTIGDLEAVARNIVEASAEPSFGAAIEEVSAINPILSALIMQAIQEMIRRLLERRKA